MKLPRKLLPWLPVLLLFAPALAPAALLYDFSFDGVRTLYNSGLLAGSGTAVTVNGATPLIISASGTTALSFPMASGGITGGRMDLPNSASQLALTGSGSQLTVALWLKWSGTDAHATSRQGLVSKLNGSQTTGWALSVLADGKLEFALGGVGNRFSTAGIPLNQWTHVAVTFVAGNGPSQNVTFYINGVAAGISDPWFGVVGTANTNPICLGNIDGTYLPANGQMDEVRLYDRALPAADIAKLTTPGNEQTKKVFAHYMVSNRDYGATVANYQHDIQDAQAYGIDGFALNVGEWNDTSNYKTDVKNIFKAAAELGTDFKLFFSVDFGGSLSATDIIDMVTTYSGSANYFRYKNKPFLSTFSGGMGGGAAASLWWKSNVLDPLNAGPGVYFIPFFYTSDLDPTPDYAKVLTNYNSWWKDVVGGFFYFGAAALPAAISTSGEAHAKVLHDDNHQYMATVSPQYWGAKQAGRRYYEYNGGEGTVSQWQSILNTQKPEWIEFVTWNDFDEATYVSPIDDVTLYWPHTAHTDHGYYKSHAAILALNKYYIDWYKYYSASEIPPTPGLQDNVFWAYRTQSASLVISSTTAVSERHPTTIEDKIYVTTILVNGGVLKVTSGTSVFSSTVPAGVAHSRAPFVAGTTPVIQLYRGGVLKFSGTGDPINATGTDYNFNYTSGRFQTPSTP